MALTARCAPQDTHLQNSTRQTLGLRRLHARVFAGLIFVNFDAAPAPFEAIANDLAAPLAPYALEHSKVAHRQNYPDRQQLEARR